MGEIEAEGEGNEVRIVIRCSTFGSKWGILNDFLLQVANMQNRPTNYNSARMSKLKTESTMDGHNKKESISSVPDGPNFGLSQYVRFLKLSHVQMENKLKKRLVKKSRKSKKRRKLADKTIKQTAEVYQFPNFEKVSGFS